MSSPRPPRYRSLALIVLAATLNARGGLVSCKRPEPPAPPASKVEVPVNTFQERLQPSPERTPGEPPRVEAGFIFDPPIQIFGTPLHAKFVFRNGEDHTVEIDVPASAYDEYIFDAGPEADAPFRWVDGIIGREAVRPHEVYTRDIDLDYYLHLSRPGVYRVRGGKKIDVTDPETGAVYEYQMATEFVLELEDDAPRRRQALEALAARVRAGDYTAAYPLARVGHPDALPFLMEALDSRSPGIARTALSGLGMIGGPEARARIDEVAHSTRTPADEREHAIRILDMVDRFGSTRRWGLR